jgi:hypothetical protein
LPDGPVQRKLAVAAVVCEQDARVAQLAHLSEVPTKCQFQSAVVRVYLQADREQRRGLVSGIGTSMTSLPPGVLENWFTIGDSPTTNLKRSAVRRRAARGKFSGSVVWQSTIDVCEHERCGLRAVV